jgi:hypothetical protein
MNHGVSGYACLGQPGDFQTQWRGEPLENIVNDPVESYLNAQNHIGIPLSNFNEPWTGGILSDENFNADPYPKPVWGEPLVGPPGPAPVYTKIVDINYPSQIGETYPQELPLATIHNEVHPRSAERQNLTFNQGTSNGDNKVFMPQTPIYVSPNQTNFQGGSVATGVHPGSDTSGQQTAGNTARADFKAGQAPYQKLPNGMSVGGLQPGEPPQLWDLAPPPDPQVLPGEGTMPLQSTVPRWW